MKKRAGSSKKKNSSLYFDDCLICRGMEKAEKEGKDLNAQELTELFQKAKERNTSAFRR